MAVKVFHTDARGFGLLSSIMAVDTISGALIAAGPGKPRFGSLPMGAAVFGIGCTLAALAAGYWWFGGALAITGAAELTFTNATNSMMHCRLRRLCEGESWHCVWLSHSEAHPLAAPRQDSLRPRRRLYPDTAKRIGSGE